MKDQNTSAKRAIIIFGSISLIILPLTLAIAFALHYVSLSDFFIFKLVKPPYSVERLLATLTSADGGFRLYTLPHLVGYIALPLFIPASLFLAYILFKKGPWYALIGATMTCIGVLFLGGVFGAWLSFAALGNLPVDQTGNLLPVLKALTTMQGPLMLSSTLSALTFLGMIILGIGFFHRRVISRWSAALFTLGNILILMFIDLDNWMFVGTILMLIGLFPLSMKLLHETNYED